MKDESKHETDKEPENVTPLGQVEQIVRWQDERLKDAGGFLSRRILGWFYQRDMIVYGNAYFMEYGNAVKYFHPRDILLNT